MDPLTYDTPADLALELRIPAADLVVRTLDTDTTTLHITGERDRDDISVVFEPGSGGVARLVVSQRRDSPGWRRARSIAVEVSAPQRTRLVVDGSAADLRTEGAFTSVSFRSASGDATLGDVREDLEARTASGAVRVGTVGGRVTATTASGDVWVGEAHGEVNARTASGDVTLGDTAGTVRVTTTSGDVSLHNTGPGLAEVRTLSGRVEVGVAAGTRAHLDVSSLSGETISDLPVSDDRGDGAGGLLDLRVSTMSGNVRIRRGSSPGTAG